MSGGQTKIVVDTNVLFMAWYNPAGKCADVLRKARENKIRLFAPDSVREEIIRVFKRSGQNDEDINNFLQDVPVNWISKEIYSKILDKARVKHKADKPVEAVSLILDCGILSADYHFKNRIDINKLLQEIE